MEYDHSTIFDRLGRLGLALNRPTNLCLVGRGLGVLHGQPETATSSLDVWESVSTFGIDDLGRACEEAGFLFHPSGGLSPEGLSLRIVEPTRAPFPGSFETDRASRFGNLTVTMPNPPLFCAAKLVRCEARDIEDVVWWVKECALSVEAVRAAIGTLPHGDDRRVAEGNLFVVELVARPRERS